MAETRWNSVAVIGVGIIGGSIGRALLRHGIAQQVIGIGRHAGRLESAREAGIISHATTDLAAGVSAADVVVACTPVQQIADDLERAARHAPPHCLLIDAGSTKETIVERLDRTLSKDRRFVGCHPLAGSEKSGFEHARDDLFEDRWVILTPTSRTQPAVLDEAARFWQSLGARTLNLSPAEHDRGVAWVSHLPHAVAAVLAACTPAEYLSLAATGWRDTTRVASGDALLWTQIFSENRAAVADALRGFTDELETFCKYLKDLDSAQLERLLAAGKHKRDAVAD
ncbi:MAG: prephenate dehydrogenase/arogenate dehydrogenase family protein [Pirellulales bacterium]